MLDGLILTVMLRCQCCYVLHQKLVSTLVSCVDGGKKVRGAPTKKTPPPHPTPHITSDLACILAAPLSAMGSCGYRGSPEGETPPPPLPPPWICHCFSIITFRIEKYMYF